MEQRNDIDLQASIESEGYDENKLLEIRVPLNVPYLANTISEFERIYGEIEIRGIHYKYVKRKVEEGVLVLLCLPNEKKTKIKNSRIEFFKIVNDIHTANEGKTKSQSKCKSFTAEYTPENNAWDIPIRMFSCRTVLPTVSFLHDGFGGIPEHPPKEQG